MRLHHLAIFARDVAGIAAFYRDLFALEEERRNSDSEGVRSVWLKAGDVILMVERAGPERLAGAAVVVFAGEAGSFGWWEKRLMAAGAGPTGRTQFTVYGRDPEGGRFGVSSWPEALG